MEEQQDGVLAQIKLGRREKLIIVLALAAVSVAFLYSVRHILPPFIWGAVAAYVLNPIVNWLSAKTRVNRGLIVLGIALLIFFILGWVLYRFTGVVTSEMRDLGGTWPEIVESAQRNLFGESTPSLFGRTLTAKEMTDSIANSIGDLPQSAVRVATRTVETLGNVLIFFVTLFLLLLDGKKLAQYLKRMTPPAYLDEMVSLGRQANRTLGAYVRGQLFLFLLMSSATYVAMGPVLQLRYAVLISIATGMLELFPIIGPIIAGAMAVAIALFQPNPFGWHPWAYAGVIALVYTVFRYMEDYFVIPNVIGRAVHLHPLVVIFALFSGGAVGGILGMFIAVPTAAVVKIVGEYIYYKLVT